MTLYNPRHMKLGKQEANIPKKLSLMTDHFKKALPQPPQSVTWSKGRSTGWGMMLNDTIGDCTCATMGHAFQVLTLNEWSHEWTASDTQILNLYEKFGYVPGNKKTDNGAEASQVLQYVMDHTFCGWTVNGFGLIDQTNLINVKQCIWLFGGAYIGLLLPKTIRTQDIWDVANPNLQGDSKPGSEGGHATWAVDYDDQYLTVITWGYLQKMTWNFFMSYCDEAYACLTSAWTMTNLISPQDFPEKVQKII